MTKNNGNACLCACLFVKKSEKMNIFIKHIYQKRSNVTFDREILPEILQEISLRLFHHEDGHTITLRRPAFNFMSLLRKVPTSPQKKKTVHGESIEATLATHTCVVAEAPLSIMNGH